MKKLLLLTLLGMVGFALVPINKETPKVVKEVKLINNTALNNLSLVSKAHAAGATYYDVIKYVYFTVSGFNGIQDLQDLETTLGLPVSSNDEDFSGIVGMANSVQTLLVNNVLVSNGITTCATIPNSGTMNASVDVDGTPTTVTLNFSASGKSKPAGYPGAGAMYDKKVEAVIAGTAVMNNEFDCATSAGWMRIYSGTYSEKDIEFIYDVTQADNLKTELFLTKTNLERLYVKLTTGANSVFDLDIIEADVTAGSSLRVISQGDWTSLITYVFADKNTGYASLADVTADVENGAETGFDNKDANDQQICIVNGVTGADGDLTACTNQGLSLTTRDNVKPSIDMAGSLSQGWVATGMVLNP